MPATCILCERNGPNLGIVTENIRTISWKSIDDPTTSYNNYNAVISLGSNSYVKYNYLKFTGSFSLLGNVKITHSSTALPAGISLITSPAITLDSQKLIYQPPTQSANPSITSTDLSSINSSISLLVGPFTSGTDPADCTGKTSLSSSSLGPLYTNYFASQIQTALTANTGDIGNISLLITWDEA